MRAHRTIRWAFAGPVALQLQEVLGLLANGQLDIDIDRVPLSRVQEVWGRDQRGRRPVFSP